MRAFTPFVLEAGLATRLRSRHPNMFVTSFMIAAAICSRIYGALGWRIRSRQGSRKSSGRRRRRSESMMTDRKMKRMGGGRVVMQRRSVLLSYCSGILSYCVGGKTMAKKLRFARSHGGLRGWERNKQKPGGKKERLIEYRCVVPSEINSPGLIARINQELVDRKLLANAEKALAKGG